MSHDDAGFRGASLRRETTGVDGAIVWVVAGEPTRNLLELGPRLRVVLGERLAADSLMDALPVRLTSPPTVLGMLPPSWEATAVEFASRNCDLLIGYWQGVLTTDETVDRLVRS